MWSLHDPCHAPGSGTGWSNLLLPPSQLLWGESRSLRLYVSVFACVSHADEDEEGVRGRSVFTSNEMCFFFVQKSLVALYLIRFFF